MNGQAICQALAKARAYAKCGKRDEAKRWGGQLIRLLEMEGVFDRESVTVDGKRPVLHVGGIEI